jgi:hypothetical protein
MKNKHLNFDVTLFCVLNGLKNNASSNCDGTVAYPFKLVRFFGRVTTSPSH